MDKNIAQLLTCIIPVKSLRKKLRNRLCLPSAKDYTNLQTAIKVLKQKAQKEGKIKVAFLVMVDGMFPSQKLYEMMLEDKYFEPFIIVIPCFSYGQENTVEQLKKVYSKLKYKYKNVICSYNFETKQYFNLKDECDLACVCNPYNGITHKYYQLKYLAKNNIPSFYIPYGYTVSNYYKDFYNEPQMPYLWKYFAENEFTYKELLENSYIKKESLVLSGYTKIDRLADTIKTQKDRKTIIIAPHHTIDDGLINFSTFTNYYDFFIKLPQMYPDIDFIFRPHPLLKIKLEDEKHWGKEKTKRYFELISSYKNVEYQDGGDYFSAFANSDGIIHDCGSFMAEYLFTKKPACYLLKNTIENQKNYNDFAKECISVHYKAFFQKDITNFIENVVINGNDFLKEERKNFLEKLKINYPKTSQKILNYIKKELNLD